MDEAQMQGVETIRSPEGRFDLVCSCPLYEKSDDRRIYYDYIGSPFWKDMRKLLIEQSPYCEVCGYSKDETHLIVHHKSYEHMCFEDENNDCCVLCDHCHNELHRDPVQFGKDHGVFIPAHKKR